MTDSMVRAAELLADAWHDAMQITANIARETGYQEGWHAGRAEENAAWCRIIAAYADVIKVPTRAQRDEILNAPRPGDHPGGPVPPW